MAKTLWQIQINFTNARRLAAELDEIAQELLQLQVRDIERLFSETVRVWQGDNARAFMSKTDTLRRVNATLARDYQQFANEIRRTAQTIYNAERRAWEIAQQKEN